MQNRVVRSLRFVKVQSLTETRTMKKGFMEAVCLKSVRMEIEQLEKTELSWDIGIILRK